MSGKVSGQVWDLDMGALIERAQERGDLPRDMKIEPQPVRMMLLALADHADHTGRNVYPGVGLLAWKTELSERRVSALLSLLRTLGILVPVRYLGGGRGHATEYRLELQDAPQKAPLALKEDGGDRVYEKDEAGDRVSQERVQSSPQRVQFGAQRVQSQTERVKPEALKGEATITPTVLTVKEPSIEPSENLARVRAREGVRDQPGARRTCERCGGPLPRPILRSPGELDRDDFCSQCWLIGQRAAKAAHPELTLRGLGQHLVVEAMPPPHPPPATQPVNGRQPAGVS